MTVKDDPQALVSEGVDALKKKDKRLPIPTECPHCSGSLKAEMDSFDLLTSILAGQMHTALSTTAFLAQHALPLPQRFRVQSVAIRALFWLAKKKNSKEYDEALIARIEVPIELWSGQAEIARQYGIRREDVYKREKFLRSAWVRLHLTYLDRYLKRAEKHEHRKALRTVVNFLPVFPEG